MISSRSRVPGPVDLNNFAMYPTLSVGYITSICRGAGLEVSVFSPLSIGVQGVVREEKATRRSLIAERLNFATAQSSWPLLRQARFVGRRECAFFAFAPSQEGRTCV